MLTEQSKNVKMESVTETPPPLWRRAVAEFLGTGLLVAIVIGSGIAAERLSPDDVGLQLLENGIATSVGLAVLIAILLPVSGAHFNPAVTLVGAALSGRSARGADVVAYLAAQIAGALAGAALASAMFAVSPAFSTTERVDAGRLLGELVATAGLVLVILALSRTGRLALVPWAVGGWIAAAYWFTSSTSFANPAVTIGRTITDTFAGISPGSAVWFIAAQLVGAAVGLGLGLILFPVRDPQTPTPRKDPS